MNDKYLSFIIKTDAYGISASVEQATHRLTAVSRLSTYCCIDLVFDNSVSLFLKMLQSTIRKPCKVASSLITSYVLFVTLD